MRLFYTSCEPRRSCEESAAVNSGREMSHGEDWGAYLHRDVCVPAVTDPTALFVVRMEFQVPLSLRIVSPLMSQDTPNASTAMDSSQNTGVSHSTWRSEEHTSELQSLTKMVCCL